MIPSEPAPSWRAFAKAIGAVCLAVTAAAGCGPSNGERPGESALERIRRTGAIRVGYANEAPFAHMESSVGRLTGEAREVLRAIMTRMDVYEVDGVLTEFGALIPGLLAKRFDVIAAGMYITPERCAQIAFSNPSYAIGEAFIVPRGNPLSLHSYEDVRDHPTATMGVMAGAVEQGYARGVGIPDERIVLFPDTPSGLDGVKAGRVDVFAGTSLTVQDLLAKTRPEQVERAAPFTDPVINGASVRGYGAFGFRKEDTDLIEAFNAELAGFVGSPEHIELVRPFGFTEENLPGGVTAAELCAGS